MGGTDAAGEKDDDGALETASDMWLTRDNHRAGERGWCRKNGWGQKHPGVSSLAPGVVDHGAAALLETLSF